jgi:endoglucanase
VFSSRRSDPGRLAASACDDLAGAAAALAALDLSRGDPERRGFAVLLTRAEEVGLVGAIHAARSGTVGREARILSIETSRELANARIGEGPIIRVGDALTAFDGKLANAIAWAARSAGLRHQRALMDGGGCEASAFGLLGYRSTGLCVALGNWHNRGNLALVEAGKGRAVPMLEEISIDDFHGLVDLIHLSITAVEAEDHGSARLEGWYEEARHYLD